MNKILKLTTVIVLLNLVIQLIVAFLMLAISGNGKVPNWFRLWADLTFLLLGLILILAIIFNIKTIKEMICEFID